MCKGEEAGCEKGIWKRVVYRICDMCLCLHQHRDGLLLGGNHNNDSWWPNTWNSDKETIH